MPAGSIQHLVTLIGIQGHARLAQNMLAGFKGGDGHGCMHIRPGADTDRVQAGILDNLLPIGGHAGNIEFIGDPLARRHGAVGHGHDLHAVLGQQAGNVQFCGIAAGANDADTNFVAIIVWAHQSSLFRTFAGGKMKQQKINHNMFRGGWSACKVFGLKN